VPNERETNRPNLAALDLILRKIGPEKGYRFKSITIIEFERDGPRAIDVDSVTKVIASDTKLQTTPVLPPHSRHSTWAAAGYAVLSLLSFLVALIAGWWIVTQPDILGVRFDRAYYVLLTILGVAAALMLFGAMRSTATVQGKHLGVAFDVGGPAALALLVVAGGFWLTQSPSSFNAKFRLRYVGPEEGRAVFDTAALVAKLRVSVGQNTQEQPISNQDEAWIIDIPGRFRDAYCDVELLSNRLKLITPNETGHVRFRGPDEVIELRVGLRP